MKTRILVASALLAGLAVSAGAVKVTYELDIPPGAKARQVANEMVAAIPPVVWATAALRQSILNGETSTTVIVARQKMVQKALLQVRDATLTSAKILRKSNELLPQNAWD
jgi:hypothetical protein